MQAHQIIKDVHEAFPKAVRNLAKITGKSEELFHSHGREPKTMNPLQSGNKSPVTHFIEYCYQHEAAEPASGLMLINRVHESLTAEFTECDLTQNELHENLVDEQADVMRWLINFEFADATPNQLIAFERECSELIEKAADAMAKARSTRRTKESGLKVA